MDRTASPATDLRMTAGEAPVSTIPRMAEERLRASGYLALRDVACLARDGVVYLHGRLPSYFLKQVAQELAAGVDGVRRVINRIDVFRPGHPDANRGDRVERAPSRGEVSPRDTEDERNSQPCWS